MNIKRSFSLHKHNTFGVDHNANYFIEIENKNQLNVILNQKKYKHIDKLILGGGSNILFTKDFKGLIFLNKILGISVVGEDEKNVILRVGSGENWDDFVAFCVNKNYFGIENLSLIPGSVGAAPIQNIGAYGVEIKTYIKRVNGIFLDDVKEKSFDNESCIFKYRDSIFKNKLKNKFFITSVDFKLNKEKNFNISYKDLKNLDLNNISLTSLRNEIIKIRNSKLPNPLKIGNAGSFFKNPYVDSEKINKVKEDYNDLIFFQENEEFKIPAAWLIEKCGWKGYKDNLVGISEKHALVLVNYGEKEGEKIRKLAQKIIDDVNKKFGIKLEPEVNII